MGQDFDSNPYLTLQSRFPVEIFGEFQGKQKWMAKQIVESGSSAWEIIPNPNAHKFLTL